MLYSVDRYNRPKVQCACGTSDRTKPNNLHKKIGPVQLPSSSLALSLLDKFGAFATVPFTLRASEDTNTAHMELFEPKRG